MTTLLPPRARLKLARLGYVTTTRGGGLAWQRLCRDLFGAGVDLILIEEPRLEPAALAAAVSLANAAAPGRGRIVGVSWPGLAPAPVDLLHLATREPVTLWPDEFPVVGRPAETLAEVAQWSTEPGLAYFTVGPIEAAGVDRVVGLDRIREAAVRAPVADSTARPWFATGGLTEDNVDEVVAAGARRLIVHRAIADAADPIAAARHWADRLRQVWRDDPDLAGYARAVRRAESSAL
jgi:thiamine-phosphate pyrophosphorylase